MIRFDVFVESCKTTKLLNQYSNACRWFLFLRLHQKTIAILHLYSPDYCYKTNKDEMHTQTHLNHRSHKPHIKTPPMTTKQDLLTL